MTTNIDNSASESAAEKIKDAALRLFSSKGIDAVTVREIVSEAGVKNNASLHYYFGSKEALVDKLILECAHHSDSARIEMLDKMEAAGGPHSVSDIVRLILDVEISPREPSQSKSMASGFGHMRFVMRLQINHRRAFMQAMAGHKNSGYMRCIEHINTLLPTVSKAVLNQRLIFLDLFFGAALAAREAAFEQNPTGGKLWGNSDTIDNLIHSLTSMLEASDFDASKTD